MKLTWCFRCCVLVWLCLCLSMIQSGTASMSTVNGYLPSLQPRHAFPCLYRRTLIRTHAVYWSTYIIYLCQGLKQVVMLLPPLPHHPLPLPRTRTITTQVFTPHCFIPARWRRSCRWRRRCCCLLLWCMSHYPTLSSASRATSLFCLLSSLHAINSSFHVLCFMFENNSIEV